MVDLTLRSDTDEIVVPGAVFAGNEVAVLDSGDADVGAVTDAGNGTVIATRADTGAVWIAEWEPGVEFYAGSGQFAGGPRMWFAGGGEPDGFLNFNAEGQKLFLNAVDHERGMMKVVLFAKLYFKKL